MLTVIRKLLDLLSARARTQLALLMMVLAVSALLEVLGIASIMPFMALVSNPETIKTSSFLSALSGRLGLTDTNQFLMVMGVVVLLLLFATNGTKLIGSWLTLRYQHRQSFHLSRRLLANYMSRPYAFFLMRNTSELGSTILQQAYGVVERVLRQVIDIVSTGLVCLAIMAVLIVVNPVVALVIGTTLGGSYLAVYLIVHRKLGAIGAVQIDMTAEMYKSASEAMSGIKDLKVLGRELTFLNKYAVYAESYARNNSFAGVISQIPRYVLEVIAFGGILSVILYLIGRGEHASEIVPVLALYAFAGYRLLPTLHNLFIAVTVMRYNIESLNLVHEELRSSPYSALEAERILRDRMGASPAAFRTALELRDVAYRYEGALEASVRGLNLSITPNTTVGLVGPTGCGKSTVVDLILGLLEPSEGRILLDGVEVTAGNRASWQNIIGYVPQNIYLSDDTVARNIAFGIPDEEINMLAVRKAAAIANLAEFIESSLDNGYDTQIGERGVRLSGGQRQRIGIARAMYRDPAILVMDEATSALDGVTEESVMRAIHSLSRRKTIVLVAHRLSTIKECDVIHQLEAGTVVASGSYEDLLRNSSWFRNAARGVA